MSVNDALRSVSGSHSVMMPVQLNCHEHSLDALTAKVVEDFLGGLPRRRPRLTQTRSTDRAHRFGSAGNDAGPVQCAQKLLGQIPRRHGLQPTPNPMPVLMTTSSGGSAINAAGLHAQIGVDRSKEAPGYRRTDGLGAPPFEEGRKFFGPSLRRQSDTDTRKD